MQGTPSAIKTAIIGARGYSGLELSRILLKHPRTELVACLASTDDWKLDSYLPESAAKKVGILPMSALETLTGKVDVVFLATPAEVSIELAPKLLAAGMSVIDLSGAFRIELSTFSKWYGFEHTQPALIQQAQFGLCPWVGPKPSSRGPVLVSNPGCYATSILMALMPVLKDGLIKPETLVIDAKSGSSGAGRKASEDLLFTEVDGECLPYRVGKHQHTPEIIQCLEKMTGVTIDPIFTTSLLATRRGIISGIYARLSSKVSSKSKTDAMNALAASFNNAYEAYPLVAHGPVDRKLPSLKRVVGSARTQISYTVEGDKLYLFSAIDNLMKGAASQAVENLNRLIDAPLSLGLEDLEGLL